MGPEQRALERRALAHERRRTKRRRRREGARAGVCVDCRTLLAPGELCDGGEGHRVAALDHRSGREKLLGAVWGSPRERERTKQLMKVGGSGVGFYVLSKIWFYGIGEGRWWLVMALLAVTAAATYWLVTLVTRRQRARRARSPRGAPRTLPQASGERLLGKVMDGEPALVGPASRKRCRAYAVRLLSARYTDSPVMLSDARTGPLAIQLDDGSRVELEAGRIRLDGPVRKLRATPATARALRARLDLPAEDPDDLSPIPFDGIEEVLLSDGDRVEISGEFEREPLIEAGNAPYREARWCYRPRSVVRLAIVSDG